MHPLLNDARDIRVVQQTGRVTAKSLEAIDQLLLILPERAKASVWSSLPQGAKLQAASDAAGTRITATPSVETGE